MSTASDLFIYSLPNVVTDALIQYYQQKQGSSDTGPDPTSDDGNLYLLSSQSRQGNGSKVEEIVRWSLGGYQERTTRPKDANFRVLGQWNEALKSLNPSQGNPYVVNKSLPLYGQGSGKYNFAQDIYIKSLEGCMFLISSGVVRQYLDNFAIDGNQNGAVFLRQMNRLSLDYGTNERHVGRLETNPEVMALQLPGTSPRISDLITYLIERYDAVGEFPYGSQTGYARNIFLMADAILSLLEATGRTDIILKALRLNASSSLSNSADLQNVSSPSRQKIFRFNQRAPYVDNFFTYSYLDNMPSSLNGAKIDPDYLYYNQEYELAISSSMVPEGVLPNHYIYKIGNEANQTGRGFPSRWDPPPPPPDEQRFEKQQRGISFYNDEYFSVLGLENSFYYGGVFSDLDQRVDSYLEAYVDNLQRLPDPSPVTPGLTKEESLVSRYSTLLIPDSDLDLLQGESSMFPMQNKVNFYMQSPGPTLEAIESYNRLDNGSGISSYLLEALKNIFKDNDKVINNENPAMLRAMGSRQGRPLPQATIGLGKYFDLPMRQVSITHLLDYGSTEDNTRPPIESFVVTRRGTGVLQGDEPSDEQLDTLKSRLRSDMLQISADSFRHYSEFLSNELNGARAVSESLAYKIIKKNEAGEIIQEIYVANGTSSSNETRDRIFTYIDTQVKYDKTYVYELYEYRIVYGTAFKSVVLPANMREDGPYDYMFPERMIVGTDNFDEVDLQMGDPSKTIAFDTYTVSGPSIDLYEIPVYNSLVFRDALVRRGVANPLRPNGRFYTPTKIIDYPPPPPSLTMYPLRGNYRQVKVRIDLMSGDFVGDNALPFITIGEESNNLTSIRFYQKTQEYFPLGPGLIQFRSENTSEIKRVKVFRTTSLNTAVSSYEALYQSFDPNVHDDVVVYTLTQDPAETDATLVNSYDLTDTLNPNMFYYYTCVSYDAHGNPSNPSTIKQVKLVYEKGKYIPIIEEFNFEPMTFQTPTKKFARYVQIGPSDIQTDPINRQNDEGEYEGIRNLGAEIGHSIANKDFIVRLTSRDTGRKFDIKLSFTQKDIND